MKLFFGGFLLLIKYLSNVWNCFLGLTISIEIVRRTFLFLFLFFLKKKTLFFIIIHVFNYSAQFYSENDLCFCPEKIPMLHNIGRLHLE
jgi:hypothetical protein